MSPLVKAFDISSNNHNGMPFNWPEAKAAGYEVVYIKATQGDNYVNPYFIQDCRDALNAGFKVGIYHYYTTDPSDKQADWFYTNGIKQVLEYTTLLPCVDVETGTPGAALEAEVNAFVAAILFATHDSCLGYMDRSFFSAMQPNFAADWYAIPGWDDSDPVPDKCVMVQYGKVKVPGIGVAPNNSQLLTDVDNVLDIGEITVTTVNPPPDAKTLAAPIVGIAYTGDGYWLAGADGGVFCYGTAVEYGSIPAMNPPIKLQRPIVAIVASETGKGYGLVGADGGIFAFGDFQDLGSIPGSGIGPSPEVV